MENISFRKLMRLIEENGKFQEQLAKLEEQYAIKLYKIGELKASSVCQLYQNMQKKFYMNRKKQHEQFWYENQLRIFIWLLLAYLYIHNKSITELNQHDWAFFSEIFNYKSPIFFEFQALSIVKPKQRPPFWNSDETAILESIMQQSKFKHRWNVIARQLFVRSGRRFFRNPKQCRQRWMNHLDPTKLHTQWTPSQDLILLNAIKKKGKRWSLAVRELHNTRTQHMVKNRYKSLILSEAKKYPEKRQSDIQTILIKRLTKVQAKLAKDEPLKQEDKVEDINEDQLKKIATQISIDKNIQKQVKVESQLNWHYQMLDKYSLEPQIILKSPIFVPWKSDSSQGDHINLMDDDKINLQNHLYGYEESQHSNFLRL